MGELSEYTNKYMPVFNRELDLFCDSIFIKTNPDLLEIFRYHLGLEASNRGQGKRLRPLLVLLCTEGARSEWRNALPAAIAVELVHNFSLIHDDIEDNGLTRRGREAVWIKWGLPIGLNAGDAMFAAAFIAINGLSKTIGNDKTLKAAQLLAETCISLTQGQHLDLSFEQEKKVSTDDYFRMIQGKTAALFACCAKMGALIGGLDDNGSDSFGEFGHYLGMAFQIYDDWLGVWGDPRETGKSASSDLVEGKKSLPVLVGFERSSRFIKRWNEGPVTDSDAGEIAEWLREDGVELHIREEFLGWHDQLRGQLLRLDCRSSIRAVLEELIEQLTIRTK